MNLNATLIIEVVSFLLLLSILIKLLYNPLVSLMDKRQKAVKDMIEGARESEEKSRLYAEQTHRALDMAKQEALKMREDARRLSDAERRKIIEEAKKEARFLVDEARRQLTQEKESVLKKIKSEVAEMSVNIAKRIIDKEIKPEDHKRLIDEAILEIESEIQRR